jgi:acyl transferase domain-containing protein/NAD(P)H-dependent flavin oxidoreductase YrpB (nitropropane dioxygenase family)/NAD(P)-dependent dehydrogenase (short-subunit alcohol dehydrogenase family)
MILPQSEGGELSSHGAIGWVVGVTPLERADAGLAAALCRAGALGVLDLGRDPELARGALAELEQAAPGTFGVRVPDGVDADPSSLPEQAAVVILPAGAPLGPWRPRKVLVQVTSIEEARAAAEAGADGVIAKGAESGGRAGDEGTFVLLQRLLAELDLPIHAQGGIGLRTAAACLAAGAAGVVLDSQLALLDESGLPDELKSVIAAMDGSETTVTEGRRLLARPDLPDGIAGGQDLALARPLAEAHPTVAGLVRAMMESARRNVAAARELRPLGPGAPLALDHGIAYPIAQGPMTRVSDVAAFAEAVAEAGGLPFLALALMREPEVRALLEDAAARLGERPWGVGILGFVPPELREEQLSVVQDVRPPVALIAGGRPAHARPLEEKGIATYLHVPSPGLLEQFLRRGARRFVLEGRECGGHVGPRTSFVLWESQLEILLADEAPETLSVLFAGGVHDARSAAMVEALAAPLAERGTKVGVLMGTAYLFTEEAVATGAIRPAFQEAALACEHTALLETAPGHATRCADTPYAREFVAERERLEREGVPPQELWERLERLNLGRLRLASKGILRDGDRLADVDAERQRRDGMVMLGQAATLRSTTTTIAELHREVSEGAGDVLGRLAPRSAAKAPEQAPADVAIVGMAAVFPGAPDLESYWANILEGIDSIGEVPPERWNTSLYYGPGGAAGEFTPSKWGGFIDPVPFDPVEFGIPPLSLAAIEPVQLIALEVARRALADAGYADRDFDRARASVIFGAEQGSDLAAAHVFRTLWRTYVGDMPEALREALPSLTEDSFPGLLANVIAGRIANRLDLGGVNYTVDAACAASLAAIDLAVKELVTGASDLVLCGGADLHNAVHDYLLFSAVQALSPTGRCRTFDAGADGIVLGEGVAALVLKRLEDAERDGDRIYAVVKGVGGSSDGRSLGLTAPNREGQVRALERAYRHAGVSPAEVGLIEAHGTGTVVGDRTELQTLADIFGRAGAAPGSCGLGSVKSQIGHTKCAAGLAGVIKTALALQRRVLPPTIQITEPNPGWDPDRSPFALSGSARPWPGRDRRAGVSAFGFGGTNFHVVLAEHEGSEARAGADVWPSELFLFRGDRLAVDARMNELAALLAADEPWRLRDLARSISAGAGAARAALVADDLDDLRAKLAAARAGREANGVHLADGEPPELPRVAFLFPGQGSQRVGMLAGLFIAFPELQRFLDLDESARRVMFPPTAWTAEARAAQQAALTDTRAAQPALGIAGLAVATLLAELGIRPDLAGGHSYGELAALCVGGAIDERALLRLSAQRAERILGAVPEGDDADVGAMAAVAGRADEVDPYLRELPGVVVANVNAPDQVVVSGPTAAVQEAVRRLAEAGLSARTIPVACAFHSPLVAAASEPFASDLAEVPVTAPGVPVYANATAAPYPADPAGIRALLARQVAEPVQFLEEIEAMYTDGARVFVETGPGQVLTGLVGRILGERPHLAVACDAPGKHSVTQLLNAVAVLAVHGVPVNADRLFEGRDAELFDLPAAPSRRPPRTAWLVDGRGARPQEGDPPAHAMKSVTRPVVAATGAAAGGREEVVLQYLRSVRELVAVQRDVVLAYLGAEPGVATPSVLEGEVMALPAAAPSPPGPDTGDVLPATADPRELLLAIVSERTGYPMEMLDLDLDLEADLGIDSIKRVEILGALDERIGGTGHDEVPEELVAVKTLRGILETIRRHLGDAVQPAGPAVSPTIEQLPGPERVERYVVVLGEASAPEANGIGLASRLIGIVDNARDVGSQVAERLEALGAQTRLLGPDEPVEGVDALVDLSLLRLDTGPDDAISLFARVQAAVLGGASGVLVATGMGGAFGRNGGHDPAAALRAGAAGLLKSLAREHVELSLRAVDLDPERSPAELAGILVAELLAADDLREIGYAQGTRHVLHVVPAHRDENPDGTTLLGPDSVVLVTGGGRGIGARISEALARHFGCRLELVGRTPLGPIEDDVELGQAPDARALRGLLANRGGLRPAEIEAQVSRILAEREIRSTLQRLREAGSEARYHPVDVRDREAFGRLIDDLYARNERLDGVIHAAGIIEDRLLRDKTPESFARVFDTKVAGALTLAQRLRDDVAFVVFFSSVASVFGNRGQIDYAAANDVLDKLAVVLNGRLPGRVLSINWGPWGEGGMVSPELARELARRGVGLITTDEGVDEFIAELLHGSRDDAQVVLVKAGPAALT